MRTLTLAIALSLAAAAQVTHAQEASSRPQAATMSATDIATRLLDHLDAGRFTDAEAMFDEAMRAAVPADKLKAVWQALPAQAGPAKGRGTASMQQLGGLHAVTIPLQYEKMALQAVIASDAKGRITGFRVQPAPAAPVPAEAVAADAPFIERDVVVGDGERALGATLAMPKGDGPFPGVVLVHGSGAHDRDESIGPNKPFADIARGLAAQGIAVLRYDKRTKVRPQDYTAGVTIDTETTDDAVTAIATLRAQPGIDPKRVFVLGHSQGGMLAPRIATRAKADGMILLAAPARPILDILIEQYQRNAVMDDGVTSQAEAQAIAALRMQVAAARGSADAPASEMPLGQSQAYWRSVEAVDPVKEAVATTVPILIVQGARDIQVVDADWQRWRRSFDGDRKAQLKLYPRLNHLGIGGDGPGTLAEYGTPGRVDAQLIGDIAGWVKAQ